MDVDTDMAPAPSLAVQPQQQQPHMQQAGAQGITSSTTATSTATPRDSFRDIHVKVHIRRPEKDSWVYMGRAIVSQEITGQSSRVVVRSASSGKILCLFSESSTLQAEKRGNFVVIGLVNSNNKVESWSLNALNNSETLRLLASIELACYKCKQATADPRSHHKARRKIERVIKDDRRRRHKRRKEQEAMIDAFAKSNITEHVAPEAGPPPAEPQQMRQEQMMS